VTCTIIILCCEFYDFTFYSRKITMTIIILCGQYNIINIMYILLDHGWNIQGYCIYRQILSSSEIKWPRKGISAQITKYIDFSYQYHGKYYAGEFQITALIIVLDYNWLPLRCHFCFYRQIFDIEKGYTCNQFDVYFNHVITQCCTVTFNLYNILYTHRTTSDVTIFILSREIA